MKVFFIALWTLFWAFLGYAWFMPVLSLSFGTGIYLYIAMYCIVLGLLLSTNNFGENNGLRDIFYGIGGLSFLGLLLGGLYSWGFFHTDEYKNLIGKVEQEHFTANIAPVSPEQMITVDEEIARRIGEKVLGEDPGLGSRCKLGNFDMQLVNGQLYWIAPLLHSGFWKWQGNDGTPGYVVVNATNERDYRLVKEVNKRPIKIRYQSHAYLGQDLERHIYMSGYMTQGLGDFTFEVDDSWQPYWTVTRYDSQIGFGGNDAIGILVVDPETGNIIPYTIDSVPSWSERIHPESFVASQVHDWGNYVHGYFNWAGKDKLHPADERSIVLGSDGQMYYYIGLQSKGADQSTVGFMMVNCRTKKTVWVQQAGATETAARNSAEGIVQEKGYVGSDGITYNIGGHATYEFLLKDKSGLMKLLALVNVHDHNVVGYGPDRLTAIRSYLTKMNSRGNAIVGETNSLEEMKVTNKISRFSSEISNGNTVYFFMVEAEPKQFFGTSSISTEFCLTQPGDSVTIEFLLSDAGEIEVSHFDNLQIGFKTSVSQIYKEIVTDQISQKSLVKQQEKVVDQQGRTFSAAKKLNMIKEKAKRLKKE